MIEKVTQTLSIENIKYEIMRTAYGNPKSILSKFDVRILIIWYLVFAIVPWFIYDLKILLGLCIAMGILSYQARVSPLVAGLLAFGFMVELITTSICTMLFGGDLNTFIALWTLSVKLIIISLATISVFTSIDPEKLSDGLLCFGVSARVSFAISYAYRILPILIDEYNSIFNSFRLRGKRPEDKVFWGANIVIYYVKIIICAFYPMLLNTAKRVKTTVEALETRGFSYGIHNKEVLKLRTAYLRIGLRDIMFLVSTGVIFIGIITIGKVI